MTKLDGLEYREMASDLMDGRLHSDAFARAVEFAQEEGETRNAWQINHLIGDVLRFGASTGVAADPAFVDRFRQRFELAQIPDWSSADTRRTEMVSLVVAEQPQGRNSANASNFRWKMVAGFASLAAVAAVTWGTWSDLSSGFSTQLANSSTPSQVVPVKQIANAPATNVQSNAPTVAVESQVMIRDPNLDALLAAHKQFGGTSALQMPAGFLRNATFEGPSK